MVRMLLRHILARLAIAARGGLHQHALLVAQVDGQAVELQLGRCRLDGRGFGRARPSSLAHTFASKARALSAAVVSVSVSDRSASGTARAAPDAKPVQHAADDTLRGRIGCSAVRGAPISSACSSWNRLVVLGVGQHRRVQHVVADGHGGCSCARRSAARCAKAGSAVMRRQLKQAPRGTALNRQPGRSASSAGVERRSPRRPMPVEVRAASSGWPWSSTTCASRSSQSCLPMAGCQAAKGLDGGSGVCGTSSTERALGARRPACGLSPSAAKAACASYRQHQHRGRAFLVGRQHHARPGTTPGTRPCTLVRTWLHKGHAPGHAVRASAMDGEVARPAGWSKAVELTRAGHHLQHVGRSPCTAPIASAKACSFWMNSLYSISPRAPGAAGQLHAGLQLAVTRDRAAAASHNAGFGVQALDVERLAAGTA